MAFEDFLAYLKEEYAKENKFITKSGIEIARQVYEKAKEKYGF